MSDGQSWTAVAGAFVTSGTPFRSKIRPRCAGTRTERYEFAWAWSTYFVPARTCNAQRRRKRAAKTTSRSTLRIATRTTMRGVGRYGSTTVSAFASARRGGRAVVVLAKELHLGRVVAAVERPQQPAHERVDGRGQDQVQHDRRHDAARDRARRRPLPEHEVHEQQAQRIEDSDD